MSTHTLHVGLGSIAVTALACLFAAPAHALSDELVEYESAQLGICMATGYGCPARPAEQRPQLVIDPCFVALNALRPCTQAQIEQSKKPQGIDTNLVGTWEFPFKDQTWVWDIARDGTYKFEIRNKDGSNAAVKAGANTGKISAGNGTWSLSTPAGYTDGGKYFFQAPDIWVVTSNLGVGAWRHPAALKNATRACTPAQSAAGVDPKMVGTWELPLKGGRWVWEILRDGSYKFHSEAKDNAPSHNGKVLASDEHWSLTATTLAYADSGLYLYQAPDLLIATGHQGAAAWHRVASSGCG